MEQFGEEESPVVVSKDLKLLVEEPQSPGTSREGEICPKRKTVKDNISEERDGDEAGVSPEEEVESDVKSEEKVHVENSVLAVEDEEVVDRGVRVDEEMKEEAIHAKETVQVARVVAAEQCVVDEVVMINVGGRAFATQRSNLVKANWLLPQLLNGDRDVTSWPRTTDGVLFFDHSPEMFEEYILSFLRRREEAYRTVDFPQYGSNKFKQLVELAYYFHFMPLKKQIAEMIEQLKGKVEQSFKEEQEEISRSLESELQLQQNRKQRARNSERLKVDLQCSKYKQDLIQNVTEFQKMLLSEERPLTDFSFHSYIDSLVLNVLIVGVTGTGKSSCLNTLMDRNACVVGGAQSQGTRGTQLQNEFLHEGKLVSFIDTQGLGADTSITDAQLIEEIILATETINKMNVLNNILVTFDLQARATPTSMANLMTLVELFRELKRSCFCCFTKWNTNDVMHEWNTPLKNWIRKWKRVESVEEITEDPPSYEDMYAAYSQYLLDSFGGQDACSFNKIATVLAFFEARVLWMYNLDPLELEYREQGEIEVYVDYLYTFYRQQALSRLEQVSAKVMVDDMIFLKKDKDTMQKVARDLISTRDRYILNLERGSKLPEKRSSMHRAFKGLSLTIRDKIKSKDLSESNNDYTHQIAEVAGVVKQIVVGCKIS